MSLFHFFLTNSTGAALYARTCLSGLSCACQGGKLMSYCEAVNYLLATYKTNHIIATADKDIRNFKQLADKVLSNTGKLWTKDLCRRPFCDESRFNGTPIEGLKCLFRERIRSYWAENKLTSRKKLACHALSLANRQKCNTTPKSG